MLPISYLFSNPVEYLRHFLIILPALLIALTFHEYAHGRVADFLGDDTPYYQGRLTLHPLPHIDWVGFVMFAMAGFGWAKPVQVNPYNFKKVGVKRGMMLVSLAGPAMNLLMAFVALVLLRLSQPLLVTEWGYYISEILNPIVGYNIILATFNLIPLPPLDGSKILAGLLPDAGARFIYGLEQYSMIILLILVFSGAAANIFIPVANFIMYVLSAIVF